MQRDNPPEPDYRYPGFTADHHTTLVGAAYGIRHFRVHALTGVLHGLTYRIPWVDGPNTAQCYNTSRGANRATLTPAMPGPEDRSHTMMKCGCGWWSYFTPEHAPYPDDLYGGGDTLSLAAVVRVWGRSVIGLDGVRSVYAQIVALVEPTGYQLKWATWGDITEKISRQYPSVAWYPSIPAMVEAWPLSQHYRDQRGRS